ncbi:Protein of unknown function (DUF3489) [Chelatococcus sambhunathii]|uniref:DUF3489 domain-containing protein n=2 Tax=Alphaproteobacteria TaxID=28211 RepID=A0ABP2AC58_9HYPH|nr:Protein of unknown function (DUF3489) [Chelatococcus sambhunathii]CUA91170.1 Protein of unknown function (DUF3489) [Chelatococcus sambhunathii]
MGAAPTMETTPMTQLSDTQAVILSAAAQRDDGNVLPLPGSLRGGAAVKVVGALLSRGLVAETVTDSQTKADAALNRIWRNDENGCAILLHITDAGLAAIGIELEGPDTALTDANETPSADAPENTPRESDPAPKARTRREGTKQATLIAMLRAPEGATIAEIMTATGWQSHTVRGAMAGALKKKLGLEVTSEKIEGRGRVYRLPPV